MDATSSNELPPEASLRRVRTALIVARFEGASQADMVLAPLWEELAAVLQLSDDEQADGSARGAPPSGVRSPDRGRPARPTFSSGFRPSSSSSVRMTPTTM